jgi:hypothetical protein
MPSAPAARAHRSEASTRGDLRPLYLAHPAAQFEVPYEGFEFIGVELVLRFSLAVRGPTCAFTGCAKWYQPQRRVSL